MNHKKLVLITTTILSVLIIAVFVSYHLGFFGHHLTLIKTTFNRLPDWEKDNHNQALETLKKSCLAIVTLDPNLPFNEDISQSGKIEHWQKICLAIDTIDKNDPLSAKKFFEFWFEPYKVYDNFNSKGIFTGYYLPKLSCSLQPDQHYTVPIHALPDDLVNVDLGLFDAKLKNITIKGQVKDHKLYPYPSRKDINNNAIDKTSKVHVWCDNKVDVVFAHIQGSAIVELQDKKQFLIGYVGSNGHPFTGIGKILKEQEPTLQNASVPGIKLWFLQHPEKVDAILNQNASYVFFRLLENDAPLGTQQVPLTPERSLAVDKRYISMGTPIWLDTTIKDETTPNQVAFRHLLIAQDTGSAIKGIIRGDVYWGSGDRAAFVAGHMKNQGRYWVLFPLHSRPYQMLNY
jgi:membrane-bound lytic murein transglycosylase A